MGFSQLTKLHIANYFTFAQDQEKIGLDIHQKNVRQQEQERQWKQLQAMRAREQQMQQMQTMPEKMHGMYNISQDIQITLIEKI